jgi:hypothetical protein
MAVAVTAALVATAAMVGAPAALAGSKGGCPTYSLSQPFQKWADTGSYFLGPGGAFEGTLTGWTASGGAAIVSGNETFYVHSARDRYSVYLPDGSAVTSPSVCVTTSTPDLRLFVHNTGSSTTTLNVSTTYTNSAGQPATVTVASLAGGSSWAPSPQVPSCRTSRRSSTPPGRRGSRSRSHPSGPAGTGRSTTSTSTR